MVIDEKHARRFGAALLLALTFLLYSPTIRFDFVNWDDDVYVYENVRASRLSYESLAWFFIHPYFNSYTPLTLLSHAVDIAVWGSNPAGHHLTNVILHACNTLWVFLLGIWLLRRISREGREDAQAHTMLLLSLFAAAFFAWHPLRVESVAWVSDRKDLLCLFFLLPSALAYLRFTDASPGKSRWRWYAFSGILFILACLSKSVAVTLPALLLLLDVAIVRRTTEKLSRLIKEKLPFALVSFIVSFVAINASPAASESEMSDILGPLERVLLPFVNIIFYLTKTFVPTNLSPIYPPHDMAFMLLASAAFVAISAVTIWWATRGTALPLVAWSAYVLVLLPSSVAVQAVKQTTADRYTYLPAVVLSLFVAGAIAFFVERSCRRLHRRAVVVAFALILMVLAFINNHQQKVWMNSETLWSRATTLYPTMPLPYNNLGLALQARGELDRATKQYVRAIELKPDYVEAYVNLSNIFFVEGKANEAERLLHRAATLAPHRAEVYNNLGIVADAQGKTLDALSWLRKSVEVDCTYVQGHFNLATIFTKMGNTAAAREALQRAARLGHAQAQETLRREGVKW